MLTQGPGGGRGCYSPLVPPTLPRDARRGSHRLAATTEEAPSNLDLNWASSEPARRARRTSPRKCLKWLEIVATAARTGLRQAIQSWWAPC